MIIKLNKKNANGKDLYQYVIFGDKVNNQKKEYGEIGTLDDLNKQYLSTGSGRSFKDDRTQKYSNASDNSKNRKALRTQVIHTTKTKTQKIPTQRILNPKTGKYRTVKGRIKLIEVPFTKVIRHESNSAIDRKSNYALILDHIEVQKSKWMDKHPQYKMKQ